MQQGISPREVWRRYHCSVRFPGCPCCGSLKLSRELKEAQRRAKLRAELRRQVETLPLTSPEDPLYYPPQEEET